MLFEDDTPVDFAEHVRILERLQGKTLALEEEVWKIARQSETLPKFENIALEYVYSSLKEALIQRFPYLDLNIQYSVNGELSEFLVDEEAFDTTVYNEMCQGYYIPDNQESEFDMS